MADRGDRRRADQPARGIPRHRQPALPWAQAPGPQPVARAEDPGVDRHQAPQVVARPLADHQRRLADPQAELRRDPLVRPPHQAHPDGLVLGRAQPVDDVDRRHPAARGRQRLPLERRPAQPQVPDDPARLVPRDVAPRGVGTAASVLAELPREPDLRPQVLPAQHLGRGEVGVRIGVEAGGQESPQLGDVLGGQRADVAAHGRGAGVDAGAALPVTLRMNATSAASYGVPSGRKMSWNQTGGSAA